MFARFGDFRFTERNRVIGTGVRGTIVRLSIELLVFQEQHGVFAPNRGSKEPAGVERVGREDYPQPGYMRERDFTALAVINRAAGQIAADWDSHHHRAGETVVRAPAEVCDFVPELHHGRPDVIEELDLRHGLQPTDG